MRPRRRAKCLPRRITDVLCFLLILISMPTIFVSEMVYVLPEFHDIGGGFYIFTWLLGIFLFLNIKGNMIATMIVDTGVDYINMNIPRNAEKKGWHYCNRCHIMAPPRSHHCKVCNACILKSDHHCLFTGCCIGLNNHRYFVLFLIYLFLGSVYAFVYNSIYLWVLFGSIYANWMSVYKMLCPIFMIVHGSLDVNMHLLFYNLNILAVVFTLIMLVCHAEPILKGGVYSERKTGYRYDAGWRRNLECIFGRRMYLAWLAPMITSELPEDGIKWESDSEEDEEEVEVAAEVATEVEVEEELEDEGEEETVLLQEDNVPLAVVQLTTRRRRKNRRNIRRSTTSEGVNVI